MSDPIDLGDFGLAFGDEQFRADEEARRAVDAELRREATQRAFAELDAAAQRAAEPPQGEPSSAIADFNRWQLERPVTTGPYAGTGAVQSSSGTGVRFPPGSPLPLAPRAQEVQRRLDSGDAAGVERDVMGQEAVTSVARPDPAMARSAPMEAPARDMGMSPPPTRREMVEASRAASPAAMLGNPREEELSRKPTRPMTGDPEEVPGAPSLADIGRARGEDVARRILHALGSGLAVAGGRSATPFRSNADAMQERRDEALQRNSTAKRQQLTDERLTRAQDIESRRQELEAERDSRRSLREDASAASEARLRELRGALVEAQTLEQRRAIAEQIESADPASAASARARARLYTRLRMFPEQFQRRIPDIEDRLATMSAEDIAAIEDELPNQSIGERGRAGGGGAVAPRAAGRTAVTREQQASERIQTAIDRGMNPASAEELERTGDLAARLGADDLLHGARASAEQYGEHLQSTGIANADSALRQVESLAQRYADDVPGFGLTGMLPGVTISAEGREMRRAVARLLDSTIREASGAAATEAEERRFGDILGIQAADLNTDEDLRSALAQAREYINDQFHTLRGAYGPEAIQRWTEQAQASEGQGTTASVRGRPRQTSQPAAAPRTVRVTAPDGTVRRMSPEEARQFQTEAARSAGFRVGGES